MIVILSSFSAYTFKINLAMELCLTAYIGTLKTNDITTRHIIWIISYIHGA